jgi:predicted metalloprotease
MRRARTERHRRVFLAAALTVMLTVVSACSSVVSGSGHIGGVSSSPNSTLAVTGDAHTSFDTLAKNAIADVSAFWTTNFPAVSGGKQLPRLRGGVYSVDDKHLTRADRDNACLEQEPDAIIDNAFYCSLDDSIAYDRVGLVPSLANRYGPFMVALVFAHEFGHAVQSRLNLLRNRQTIYKESQADCAAGAYAAEVLGFRSPYFRVSAAALDKVLIGYIQLRDPVGTVAGEAGSHGDGFDRLSAVADGINNGVKFCYAATWDTRTFTERPFSSDADYETGGDETEAQVLNPADPTLKTGGGGLQPSLNAFWTAQAKTIGKTFQPVKIAEAAHPPCQPSSEFGYCPADNTVYYSRAVADAAYSDGDYALGTLFVYGWGLAVRQQLFGQSIEDQAALLAAGCYAGAYSKSVNTTGSGAFQLSAPDMDEATITVLTTIADPAVLGPRDTIGLDRIESFKKGYFGGLSSC